MPQSQVICSVKPLIKLIKNIIKILIFLLYYIGKGIYFSDVPTKAANYCHASIDNNEGYLILTEVALGNIHEVYRA